eukprot:tig00000663_g2955.t1
MEDSNAESLQLDEKLRAAADEVFREIEARGELDDAALEKLIPLFPRSLEHALEILDKKQSSNAMARPAVERVVARRTGRCFSRVIGHDRAYYVVLARYCSCQAFMNLSVARPEALYCKHMLAARLARALGTESVTEVEDGDFAAQLLLEAGPGSGSGSGSGSHFKRRPTSDF